MTKTQMKRITKLMKAINETGRYIFHISDNKVTMTVGFSIGWEFPIEILQQTGVEFPVSFYQNSIETLLNECEECVDYEDTHINAKEFLSELKAIYKEIKKTDTEHTKVPYIIKHNGEYYGFQISQLIEVLETLGANAEIFIHCNSKIYKPLYIKSDIGRAVLLPVKLKDITCIKENKTI